MKNFLKYIWIPIAIMTIVMAMPHVFAQEITNVSGTAAIDQTGCYWTPSNAPGISTSSLTVPDNEVCYISESMSASTVTVATDGDATAPFGGTLIIGSNTANVTFTIYTAFNAYGIVQVGYGTTHPYDAILSTNSGINLNVINGGTLSTISNTTGGADNRITVGNNIYVGSGASRGTLTLNDASSTNSATGSIYLDGNSATVALRGTLNNYGTLTAAALSAGVNSSYGGTINNYSGASVTITNSITLTDGGRIDNKSGAAVFNVGLTASLTGNAATDEGTSQIINASTTGNGFYLSSSTAQITMNTYSKINNTGLFNVCNTTSCATSPSVISVTANNTDIVNGTGGTLNINGDLVLGWDNFVDSDAAINIKSNTGSNFMLNTNADFYSKGATTLSGTYQNTILNGAAQLRIGSTGSFTSNPTTKANSVLTLNNTSSITNAGSIAFTASVSLNNSSTITNNDSGAAATFTIDDQGGATVNSITLNNSATTTDNATFTNTAGATTTVGAGTTSLTDGRIYVYNAGQFNNTGGTVSAATLWVGNQGSVRNGGTYTNSGTTGSTTLRYVSTTAGNYGIYIYQGHLDNSNATVSPSFICNAPIYLNGTDASTENKGRLTNSGIFEQKSTALDILTYSQLNLTGGRLVQTNASAGTLLSSATTSVVNISAGAVLSYPTITITNGTLTNNGDIKRVNIAGTLQNTNVALTVSNSSIFNNNAGSYLRSYNGTVLIDNTTTFSNAGAINYVNPTGENFGTFNIYTTNSITNSGTFYGSTIDIRNTTFNNSGTLNGTTVRVGSVAGNTAIFNNTGTITATTLNVGTQATWGSTFNNNGTATIGTANIYTPGTYTNYITKSSAITTLNVYRETTAAYLTGGTAATSDFNTWKTVADGSFSITLDGTVRNITGINFKASLAGGTLATSDFNTWKAVTNGTFRITIDGTQRDITAIDFSTVTSMDDVAAIIQTKIRAATGALETCVWSTNQFIITAASSITVTSATGSGTDISGVNSTTPYMDAETGRGTVTAIVASMADVAARIQTAIRNVTGAFETCVWSSPRFIITADDNLNSSITVTSAVGSGTDISGVGATAYMDADIGTVTARTNTTATFTNNGTLTGTSINLGSAGLKGGVFDNNGTVTETGNSYIYRNGIFTNASSQTATIQNLYVFSTGLMTNNGILKGGTLSPPQYSLYVGDSSNVGGTLNNNGTLSYYYAYIRNGGELTNAATKSMEITVLTLNSGNSIVDKALLTNDGTITGSSVYVGNSSTDKNLVLNNNSTGTMTYSGSLTVYGAAPNTGTDTPVLNNYGIFNGAGILNQGYQDSYRGGIINNYNSFSRTTGTFNYGAIFNNKPDAIATFTATSYLGFLRPGTAGEIAVFNQEAGTNGNTKASFYELGMNSYGTFNNNDKISVAGYLNISADSSATRLALFNGNAGSTTAIGSSTALNGTMTIAEGASISWGTTVTADDISTPAGLYPSLTVDGTVTTAQRITIADNCDLITGNNSNLTLTGSPSILLQGVNPYAEVAGTVNAHSIHANGTSLSGGYLCIGDYYPAAVCTNVATSTVTLTGVNADSIYTLPAATTATIEIANDVAMAGGITVQKGTTGGTTSKVNIFKDATITINGRTALGCYNATDCAIDVGAYNTAAGNAEMNVYGTINLATAANRKIGIGYYDAGTGVSNLSIKSHPTLGNGYINDATTTRLMVGQYIGKLNIERTDAANYGQLYLGGTCTINSPGTSTDHNRGANIDGTMRCYTSLIVAATGSVDQSYVDTLAYNSQGGTNFTIGETITGGTSGATAKILVDTDAGATGTLTIYSITKNFSSAETITGSSSGSTATTGSANAYADRSVVTVDGSDTTVNGMYYLDGLLNSGNLTVNSGGHVTSSAGVATNFYINADNLTVNSGGYIDSDEVSTVDRTGTGTGGGSYAGHGLDSGGTPVATYGTTKETNPVYGMRGENAGASSANGGGGVNIFADGNVTINGEISANGAAGGSFGGGSGGTVIITQIPIATGAFFTGTGTITALGGDGTYPGGGGRVVIDSKLLDDPDFATYDFGEATAGTVKAFGGANGTTSYAAAGTIVYLGDSNNSDDTLIIDQNNKALAGSYITDIVSPDSSFDRVELRNTAKADLDGLTINTACYILSSSSESGSTLCSNANSKPDKPDTLYINNSVIKAGSGDEPSYIAGKGTGVEPTAKAVGDLTPVFSAIYQSNASPAKSAVNINIQVDNNNTFASPEWDYAGAITDRNTTPGTLDDGERSADVEYAGTAIVPGDTYYFRVRFTDLNGDGLWSHADYNDQNKFVINNYFDIYPICAGNTFAIKDANNPTDNIKNQNGKRFGKGTCTMGVLSGNTGAWQIKFGMTEAEGIDAAVAFGDGTNDIDPIDNTTTCDLDESGDTATEAYGFNIAGSTVGTPVSDAPPCTGTTFATADKYHNVELYSAIQQIITGTGTMLTEQTFPLNIFVNVDAGTTVSAGYNLGMAFIMTTNP